MLTLALAAALIGFGLLVAALITSNFWVAVACIIVCAVGLVLLVWDILRSSRQGAGTEDPPRFTIRDQASESRSEPLLPGPDDDAGPTEVGFDTVVAETAADTAGPADTDTSGSGLGALVDTGSVAGADKPVISGPLVTGDAHDYIKSITGSFPVQVPTSDSWSASSATPAPTPAPRIPEPAGAEQPRAWAPSVDETQWDRNTSPATGPIPANSPYVGRRRRTEAAAAERLRVPAAPVNQAGQPPVAAPPSGRIRAPKPAADLGSEGIVVHDHTGPLPKITIVDPDA
ncbi:MAG: hypothetical protein WAW85_16185 [Gordonia sp. (in: high G+C Gram-positive bacteria)]|uniref:hypothetical protein n=1 Tax=Gordonia sp. (in: high G+C Gram-positive bacteria) TaxID=84139 RepID=UPI003BB4E8D3